MEITIIAETSGEGIHPVTEQLVGAASSLGGVITVLCPGGRGSDDASVISGVSKVISLQGDCFSSFDSGSWSTVMAPFSQGIVMASSSPSGRELGAQIASKIGVPIVQDITGIDSAYEKPDSAEIILNTQQSSPEELVEVILKYLKEKNKI